MTMTITRRAAAPPQETPAKLPRGSAQRVAVITLVVAVIFQPILHPTGPGNSSPVDLFIIVAIVASTVWLAGTHRKLRAPYVIPFLLYIAAGAASGLVSLLPTTALLTLAIDIMLFAWCTTVVNVLSGPRAMRYALVAWSWSGIAWAGIFLVSWAGHITPLEGIIPADGNRLSFTFGDPNYCSWFWFATIFVIYASRTPGKRWMRLAGYGVLVWAMALTESNGGAVSLLVGIIFLLMFRSYRRHGWAGAIATGLAIGLAVGAFFTVVPIGQLRSWAANSHQVLLANSIGRSAQSSNERGLIIQETWALYKTSDGVLGLGPQSTKQVLADRYYPYSNEAHDDWLAALEERGVIGLFALILLACCVIARAGPILRRPLSAPMAAAVPNPAGIVAAVLAVSISSFYEEVSHFRSLWLLVGILAVLGQDAWHTHQADRQRRLDRLHPAALTRLTTRPPGKAPGADRAAAVNIRPPLGPYIPPVPSAVPEPAAPGTRFVSRQAASNLGAQVGALGCAAVASLLVARAGGPTVLGYYALLRVLPWLFGVVISCGLPTSSAYFMAGEHGKDRRGRPTICVMAVIGAGISGLAWLACAVPFRDVFFKQMPLGLIVAMTISVVTWLVNVTAKACCQGSGDIAGANLLIVAEEFWFLPVYITVRLVTGQGGSTLMVASLIVSGVLYTATAMVRLWSRGFFYRWGRPSARLARRIAAFGARGQLGNMLWLTNLRFDFVLLGALAGPAVLGIYAVASKFAELMRLAPTAINYVLYPWFTRIGKIKATAEARRLLPLCTALTVVMTPFLAAATYVALPILYGHAFDGAVKPAEIIIIGLSVEGAAAVASAYLLGLGRPGLQSVGMAVGATITVTLDIILIPRLGAMGGAITSTVTYLTTTMVLVLLARGRIRAVMRTDDSASARPEIRSDSRMRRAVDILVAAIALVMACPVIVLLAAMVRLTSRGPAFYRQERVGRSEEPFTILKLRTMVCGADRSGPLITSRADPRVTRLGAMLRATKLDELPQIINVLKGDMTLIGPRPEVPRYIPFYSDDGRDTLKVRPGLTGAGQIFYTLVQQVPIADGEDEEQHYITYELPTKLTIDLDYVRRRSLRQDLMILACTVLLMAKLHKVIPALIPAHGKIVTPPAALSNVSPRVAPQHAQGVRPLPDTQLPPIIEAAPPATRPAAAPRSLTVAEALPATIVADGKLDEWSPRRFYPALVAAVMVAATMGTFLVLWLRR